MSISTIKVSQDTDIPAKILKEDADYFADSLIYIYFNESISSSKFPSSFKCATSLLFSKCYQKTIKITAGLSAS